jgi:hypothetical protein
MLSFQVEKTMAVQAIDSWLPVACLPAAYIHLKTGVKKT